MIRFALALQVVEKLHQKASISGGVNTHAGHAKGSGIHAGGTLLDNTESHYSGPNAPVVLPDIDLKAAPGEYDISASKLCLHTCTDA